jgi:hypothetical protein
MAQQNAMWMLPAMAAIAMPLIQPLQAEVLEKTKEVGGTVVYYKLVLPDGYDPAKAYPAVLAFGGGPQTMNTVDNILNRNFRAEAEKRGYIVVAPAQLRDAGAEKIFRETASGARADRVQLLRGLAAARTGGRPPKLTEDDLEPARALLANPDIGVTQIADRLGVSPATLYRYIPAARTANAPVE